MSEAGGGAARPTGLASARCAVGGLPQDALMDMAAWVAWLSMVVSVAALGVAIRRPAIDLVNDGVRTSADEISATLAGLRRAVWASARTGVESDSSDLADALVEVRLAFEVHRAHLPPDIAALGREVSMAVGNYAGATGLAWVDPDAGDNDRSPHDPYWWDVTITYIDYAITQVQLWRRNPRRRRSATIAFHAWRKDEDSQRSGER